MTVNSVRAGDPAAVQSEVPTAVVGMTIKVDSAPPPLIEVSKISKRFGSLQALSDVSLTLRPGPSGRCWARTAPAKAPSSNASWAPTAPIPARYGWDKARSS